MGLKVSHGNMYDWVTHMHSHLGGKCPHECKYCYVQRNPHGVSPRWQGELRILGHEFKVDYGQGKIIFIEHMNDMFADGLPDGQIMFILEHCRKYPDNEYVFQTKNPARALLFKVYFPKKFMIGTTIESNRAYPDFTKAPTPEARYMGMREWRDAKKFVTIEPIMDFDTERLGLWLLNIEPDFVNIGADSKRCFLPEPPKDKVTRLINILKQNNITIKKKVNLGRLMR